MPTMSTPPNQEPATKPQDPALPDQPGSEGDLPPEQPGSEEKEEEEEEGECGFCLFMKGGGCRDAFIGWEKCVQEAETNKEDLLEKCAQVTAALKQCMDAHSDYYEPILRAEKLAEEQAIVELEREKEKEKEIQQQQQQQPPPPQSQVQK